MTHPKAHLKAHPTLGKGYGSIEVYGYQGVATPRFAILTSGPQYLTLNGRTSTQSYFSPLDARTEGTTLFLSVGPEIVRLIDSQQTHHIQIEGLQGSGFLEVDSIAMPIGHNEHVAAGMAAQAATSAPKPVSAPVAAAEPAAPAPPPPAPEQAPIVAPAPVQKSGLSAPVITLIILLLLGILGFVAWKFGWPLVQKHFGENPPAVTNPMPTDPIAEKSEEKTDGKTGENPTGQTPEKPAEQPSGQTAEQAAEKSAEQVAEQAEKTPVQAEQAATPVPAEQAAQPAEAPAQSAATAPRMAPLQTAREHLRGTAEPPKSVELAHSLRQEAATNPVPSAQADAADAAFLLVEDAAQKGYPPAMLGLGQYYDPSDSTHKGSIQSDAAQAYQWYSKAQAQGQAEATAALQRLRTWLEGKATQGNADAKRLLQQWN